MLPIWDSLFQERRVSVENYENQTQELPPTPPMLISKRQKYLRLETFDHPSPVISA